MSQRMVSPDLVSNMRASRWRRSAPVRGAYARREAGSIAARSPAVGRRTSGNAAAPAAGPRSRRRRRGPTGLEAGAFVGEDLGQPLHRGGDQAVGLLHRLARLVDEAGLDRIPTIAEPLG